MKLNKAGMICGGLYTAYFLVLIWFAYVPFSDTKAGGLYLGLAVAPALLLLSLLDLEKLASPDSWMNSAAFLFAVNLVISYLFGLTVSAIGRRLAPWLDRLDERVLDRFDKDI